MANLFQSSNPTLSEKYFNRNSAAPGQALMTARGTLNKFGIMVLLMLAAASFTWKAFQEGKIVNGWMIGGVIVGFIVAIVMTFKPQWSPTLAPVYALAEGFFLGAISAYYSDAFRQIGPGIVMQAVGLTFGAVIAMFLLYRFQIIKATEGFKNVVLMATAGIGLFYLIAFILRLFGIQMPMLHDSSWLGIGFSLVVVVVASLNLILDFDRIEQGSALGAPKYMEWYSAFGLLVTIVWLYLEILRLLARLSERK